MRRLVAVTITLLLLPACTASDRNDAVQRTPATPPTMLAVATMTGEQIERAPFGQTIYVPAYSHIYHGDNRRAIDLTITLSIRNTYRHNAISVTAIQYYDSNGTLIRSYTSGPLHLGPLASTEVVIAESDTSGGINTCAKTGK